MFRVGTAALEFRNQWNLETAVQCWYMIAAAEARIVGTAGCPAPHHVCRVKVALSRGLDPCLPENSACLQAA